MKPNQTKAKPNYPHDINGQLGIKLRQFTEKELDVLLKTKKEKTEMLLASMKHNWSFENKIIWRHPSLMMQTCV